MKRRQPSSRVKLDHHKVWELLNRLNMTQNELARLVGTSSGYLSQLMSGDSLPLGGHTQAARRPPRCCSPGVRNHDSVRSVTELKLLYTPNTALKGPKKREPIAPRIPAQPYEGTACKGPHPCAEL